MNELCLDVWSDIACPWCYVGKRRLEAALSRFEHRDAVTLRWRPFELDPDAPAVHEPEPYAERLARKYRTSPARAKGMIDSMTHAAAAEGLELRFDRIRPGNTFDAHRLIRLAASSGLADKAKERFLRAYLSEGEPIGEPAVLERLATEIGLGATEARALLTGDGLADEVRAEEQEAHARGIHAVPYFLVDGRLGLSGAQPHEILLQALRRAWSE